MLRNTHNNYDLHNFYDIFKLAINLYNDFQYAKPIMSAIIIISWS